MITTIYNYAKQNADEHSYAPDIDYSDDQTVPDAVLSMRDIWRKYCATGEIADLSGGTRPMISSDVDESMAYETEFDEPLDILRESMYARTRAQNAASSAAKPADKPQNSAPQTQVPESENPASAGSNSPAKPQNAGSE